MAKKFMTNAEIMKKASAEIDGLLYQIRNDKTRTEAYKKQEIARAYKQMRAERDRLIEQRDSEKRTYQLQLERSIFAADNSADGGISRRDASDRAAKLEQPSEAQALLARAERQGDEHLARAIAERAYEMRWDTVANDFIEQRPQLSEPFSDLWTQRNPSMQEVVHDGILLSEKPQEIAALDDYQIERLASEPLDGEQPPAKQSPYQSMQNQTVGSEPYAWLAHHQGA